MVTDDPSARLVCSAQAVTESSTVLSWLEDVSCSPAVPVSADASAAV
jgi:hypothetical protein